MVGGTPKPFPCTHEGCSMTFTNEDHLNVHQKKHVMDLNLNLGTKPNSLVVDQTPTPTRFLRNCEEVGLFQDLQHVNPFEQSFRKAAELVETGSLPEPDLPTDDTLHTPHVFPLLTVGNQIFAPQTCSDLPDKTIEHILPHDLQLDKNIFDNDTERSVDHNYASNTKTNEKSIITKSKLKQALLNNKKKLTVPQTVYVTPASNVLSIITTPIVNLPLITSSMVDVKAKYEASKSRKIESSKVGDTREQVLERNRAAAFRYREKEKRRISTLENNYERVCKHNQELMKEVSELRNEVVQLKTLLLTHKDCPVTRAMVSSDETYVMEPSQLLTIQLKSCGDSGKKTRFVLPKENISDDSIVPTKVRKVAPKPLNVKNLSFISAQSQKSVIVLNTSYSDIPNT